MVYNSIVILDYIMDTDSQLSMMLHVHNLCFCDLYFVHYGRCQNVYYRLFHSIKIRNNR